MKQDIWSILQIEPTDSKREIRRAYAAQARKYHPEEQPEEFAGLQEAYQLALKYTEQSSVGGCEEQFPTAFVMMEEASEVQEDVVPKESSKSLLAELESGYEAEQKRRQNEGALKALITLFEDPKAAKGNKAWAEFFQSDLFLQEYFSEEFAEALDYYLEHQTIYAGEGLPQGFLVEWAITYAMIAERDGCMYSAGDIPMRKVVAKYWNVQDEFWRLQRGVRMLVRPENQVKIRAFSDYTALRMLQKQGDLTLENEYGWREMVWHGKPNHLYEVSKVTGKNATSIILLQLFKYWISMEEAPLLLAEKMYQEYNLKGNEKSSYYSVYKELKEAILQRFPDIESEDVQDAIKEWTGRLIALTASFASRVDLQFEPETENEKAEMEKLFAEEVWKQYWNLPFMMEQLVWKLKFHNMPLTIAQHLYETYSLPEGIDNYYRMELREHSMMAIVNYRKHTDKKGAMFWEYFFQRGFGVCSIEVATTQEEIQAGELKRCIKDDRLYLPAYMKSMYRIVKERQKDFLGYRVDIGEIDKPQCYEFALPDGDVIKAEYYLHFVAYYRNGQRIYKPYLTYDALEAYEKVVTKTEEFFFLLALTILSEADREAARKLILKWLPQTMLVESTFSVIADCIVQNNALDRSTDACGICETENMCLMVQRTEQELGLYEYTDRGWISRDFRAGMDWQNQEIEAVAKAHLKPVPKRIESVEIKGLSVEEKAKVVWDSLLLYAKHEKGGGLSAPIQPKEYPVLHKAFGEGGMGWLTDSFVVLYYEISPNNIFRQVLYITVGDWGCGSAYIKNNMPWDDDEIRNMQNRVRRQRAEEFILRGSMIREEYPEQQSSCVKPILFGESGKMYGRYGMAKVCETESAFELLSKMLELENAVRCEVYEGKMTVSAQSGQLEYCFGKDAFREACAAHEKDWADAYAIVEARAEEEGLFEQEASWDDWEDDEEYEADSDKELIAFREERRIAEREWMERYRKETLEQMTGFYLMEMDKEERYKNRCETLVEYYCVIK